MATFWLEIGSVVILKPSITGEEATRLQERLQKEITEVILRNKAMVASYNVDLDIHLDK